LQPDPPPPTIAKPDPQPSDPAQPEQQAAPALLQPAPAPQEDKEQFAPFPQDKIAPPRKQTVPAQRQFAPR
jgi:hypothetical protein